MFRTRFPASLWHGTEKEAPRTRGGGGGGCFKIRTVSDVLRDLTLSPRLPLPAGLKLRRRKNKRHKFVLQQEVGDHLPRTRQSICGLRRCRQALKLFSKEEGIKKKEEEKGDAGLRRCPPSLGTFQRKGRTHKCSGRPGCRLGT